MSAAAASLQLRQLREQWQGNPRLRWGVAIIAAILFLYLLLVLWDWRQTLHAQYQQRTLQFYKTESLVGQDKWLLQAQDAATMERALRAEIPQATSLGLAQAEVQAWARQLLQTFGQRLNSQMLPPAQVQGQPGLWRIPVSLHGVTQPRLLLELLRLVESNQRLTVVESSSIRAVSNSDSRPDSQGMTINLTIVAYYRIAPAKGGSDAAP